MSGRRRMRPTERCPYSKISTATVGTDRALHACDRESARYLLLTVSDHRGQLLTLVAFCAMNFTVTPLPVSVKRYEELIRHRDNARDSGVWSAGFRRTWTGRPQPSGCRSGPDRGSGRQRRPAQRPSAVLLYCAGETAHLIVTAGLGRSCKSPIWRARMPSWRSDAAVSARLYRAAQRRSGSSRRALRRALDTERRGSISGSRARSA